MHLVIGAAGYAGRYAIAALGERFPVRGLEPGPDLAAALAGVDTVHMAAELHPPTTRLSPGQGPHPFLVELVRLASEAGVRRLVHLSTAQVLGPAPRGVLLESSPLKPDHAYEKLHARDERWLLARPGLEVVVLRPAQGFGRGEPIVTQLLARLAAGRPQLVRRGHARRTFLAGSDLGRAFVAAALRGRTGHAYLLGGFESTWRDLLTTAARALRLPARLLEVPYDLAYLTAAVRERLTPRGQECWPNPYGVDLLGRAHVLEDGLSRRELSWSPLVGSFEEGVAELAEWFRKSRASLVEPEPQRPGGQAPDDVTA
jgi:nucleoside-diphosphate-sugar epimerase